MYLQSIASHFPEHQYTQKQCLQAMQKAPFWAKLSKRSHRILEKVFTSDTGIDTRHFALEDLTAIWGKDAQQLNEYYEEQAPKIAARALEEALMKLGKDAGQIDVLLVCSCTGFLCPGVSSYVAERLSCNPHLHTQDITGHGCGAAIPMLQVAQGYLAADPSLVVATVAVEVCSAAFYVSNEVDVLISTCLFGDGASAAIWTGKEASSGSTKPSYKVGHFKSLLVPEEREKVRFVNAQGKLKNQLAKSVPELTARAAKSLYEIIGGDKLITHGGGRDVVEALIQNLPVEDLPETREVLRKAGNLSSPSVMVALQDYLENGGDAESLWLASFGAGFSAHCMRLERV